MSSVSSNLNRAINDSIRMLESLNNLEPEVSRAADLIGECFRTGNKLLMCGNGGSAADASHFATELVVRFAKERRALPAICLASDSGILTAAGNDYGFDKIFARQVAAFGQAGDVLVCFTTSGNSRNVLSALEEAKARNLKTIAFLGREGGSTVGISDVDLLVKDGSTARIQEAHQLLIHVLCEIIDAQIKDDKV
jgi:phosphoheptose isomerase